ncbi:FUSC family protein, partial [Anoxybacillus sp. LAT27]|nr:FUSC family protein [Anoxybacillus sp. LAT27]
MFLHHERSYWISLTVALVLQRNFASALTRTVQRGIGTAAGVLLSGLLLLG